MGRFKNSRSFKEFSYQGLKRGEISNKYAVVYYNYLECKRTMKEKFSVAKNEKWCCLKCFKFLYL